MSEGKPTSAPNQLSEAKRLLLEKRLSRAAKSPSPSRVALLKRPTDQPALASLGQKRIWLLDDMSGHSPSYNITSSFYIKSDVDRGALEFALNQVVARHEPLRSCFLLEGEEVIQTPLPSSHFKLECRDCEGGETIEAAAQAFGRIPFDLKTGPLLRLGLFSQGEKQSLLILSIHDIVFDKWSLKLFWKEFSAFYDEAIEGSKAQVPAIGFSYSDFSYHQRRWLAEGELQRQLDYWTRKLSNPPPPLPFATDRPFPEQIGEQGSLERHSISAKAVSRLRSLAISEDASPFMVFLLGFSALLAKYTGTTDLLISSPVANRRHQETADLIGFFLNTFVIRADLAGDPTMREALRRIRATALEALDHQDLPPDSIVEALKPKRVPGRHPLFQTMFVFQREDEGTPKLSLRGCVVEPTYIETKTSKFDLSLFVAESGEAMEIIVEYRSDLFDADTMRRFLCHYEEIVGRIGENPNLRLSELTLLGSDDLYFLMAECQGETVPLPDVPILPLQISAWATKTPEAVALQDEWSSLSYAELELRSTALARTILQSGGDPMAPVGIYLERSVDAIVAIIATMRAGAPYLPLDPVYPTYRNQMVIQDARPRCIVCAPEHRSALEDLTQIPIVEPRANDPSEIELPTVERSDIAYLIYTSGSSGRPKAVMVTHDNLRHSNFARSHYYHSLTPERLLLLPSLSFDSSVASIFWTLGAGKTLVLPRHGEEKDPEAICALARRHSVTTLLCVPSLYRAIIAANPSALNSLRAVIVAGESCPPSLVSQHYDALPNCSLFNEYGPTEATVWCSAALLAPRQRVSIGKPIPNCQLHILSEGLQLLPIGLPGEIYVAGPGVAKGYLNNDVLTDERFPVVTLPNGRRERMYRTGDRARRLPDGSIDFIGRLDEQHKISGFRIELGEVESALNRLSGILESAAKVALAGDEEGAARLIAFVKTEANFIFDSKALKGQLADYLPQHAIPNQFVRMDSFPKLPNGKIDRRSLPDPEFEERDVAELALPRNEKEKKILEIWKDVLQLPQISTDDNFFDIGGTSLLAIRLFSRIKSTFECTLPVGKLIQYPSIQKLATLLDQRTPTQNFKYLVPLKRGHEQSTTVFLVHSGGLQVLFYRDLARHLDDRISLFGIQPVGHDGSEEPLDSIEEMAKRYLLEIRQAQPEGPYFLLGHCFGVAVAIEIAKRLQEQGQTVPLIISIDGEAPLPPGYIAPRPPSPWRFEMTPRQIFRLIKKDIRRSLQTIKDSRILREGSGDAISGVRIRRTGRAVLAAFQSYRSDPYLQPILAFHCLDSEAYPNHSRADWRRAAPNMHMIEMDCLHREVLADPHVRKVAQYIEMSIRDALANPEPDLSKYESSLAESYR